MGLPVTALSTSCSKSACDPSVKVMGGFSSLLDAGDITHLFKLEVQLQNTL